MFNIADLQANFNGGIRTAHYFVEIVNPAEGSQDTTIIFRIDKAQLPPWRLGQTEVGYFGRKVKYAKARVTENWTVSLYEDEDMAVRNALEHWSNWVNLQRQNIRGFGISSDNAYKTTAKIYMRNKIDESVREYQLFGIWPVNVGEVQLDWDDDEIMRYDVEFSYDYMEITGGSGATAGNPASV